MITLKQHPLGALLPTLSEQEMDELAADIKANGQVDFITLHEGKVLDGWQRYQACKKVGIEPKTTKFSGKDAKAFVWSKSLRRNLSASQKAQLAVGLNPPRPEGRPSTETSKNLPVSNSELAEQIGVSVQTVKDARTVEQEGSAELKQAVIDGEVSVSAAAKVTDLPKKKQAAAARKPRAKKPPKEKPKDDESDNLVKQMEADDREIKKLQTLVESLQKSDLAKEVKKWVEKYGKLEGLLHSRNVTLAEAQKTAQFYSELLGKIRKALKVSKNTEILEAIRQA